MESKQAWWSKSINKGFQKGSDYFDKYSPKVVPSLKAGADPWKAGARGLGNVGSLVGNSAFGQGVARQTRRIGDVVTRGAGGVRRTVNTIAKSPLGSKGIGLLKSAGKASLNTVLGKNKASRYGLALGVVAMAGIGIMKGAMNESRNIVYERYMQDMTYSRSMVGQSRVGLAHGTHNMLNNNGTQGLSNSLSATRHGRY